MTGKRAKLFSSSAQPLSKKSSSCHFGNVSCVLKQLRCDWHCDVPCNLGSSVDASIQTLRRKHWLRHIVSEKNLLLPLHGPLPFTQFLPYKSQISIYKDLLGLSHESPPWATISVLTSTPNYRDSVSKQKDEMIKELINTILFLSNE